MTGYRFYEPNLQRWLNEDPIREDGGMNLFGFVGNNPMSYVDGLGLVEFNWFGIFDNDYPEYIKKNNAEWDEYLKRKAPYDAGMKAINWNDPKSLGQSMDLFNKYRPDLGKPSQPYMLSEPGVGQFLALDGAIHGVCKLMPKGSKPATTAKETPATPVETPTSKPPTPAQSPCPSSYDAFKQGGYTYTERMTKSEFAREFSNTAQEGIKNPVIQYVEINGDKYIVGGNNRLRAAKKYGKTDQLIFEKVNLPFKGFKNANDVMQSAGESLLGGQN